jgi:plastocyanin
VKRIRAVAALAALVAFVGSACSVSPGDKVDVTMKDFSIAVSPAKATSGRVRFAIDSVGEQTHSFALMLQSDPTKLVHLPDGKLDLEGANRPIDEIEPFEPGHYIATTPNLLAGDYLMICTLHFDQGMYTKFHVDPRKKKAA